MSKTTKEVCSDEKKISFEKPQIDAKTLESLSKAFASKSGMSSC